MLEDFKTVLSFFLLIPLVALIGIFLSFKFRFVQCRHLFTAWRLFLGDKKPSADRRSTSFSAVSAVLGGNLGTGNISGIAVALSMGGPGALFWMWIMASLGAVLKFVNCTLGILYREKNIKGEYVGGPMYYLGNGLNMKKTAKLYCFLAILTALTVGNLVQMNSLSLPFTQAGVPPALIGITMSLLVGAVILGGLRRFSLIASLVVPVMAIVYIVACLFIILSNLSALGPAFKSIFEAAFQWKAAGGGIASYTLFQAMRVGFDRGLFATDVGVGVDAIIHSSVESKMPIGQTALTQGLISTVSPLVVMLVCTLTGLVLMITDTWSIPGVESTNLCIEAFRRGFSHPLAGHIITMTLFFFAFTTILTWSFCADKAIEYLTSAKYIKWFQAFFICTIPVGAFLHVQSVWTLADIFMNLMLIINLIGLVGLSQKVWELYQTAGQWISTT